MSKHPKNDHFKTLDTIDEQLAHTRRALKLETDDEKRHHFETINTFLLNAFDTEYEQPGNVTFKRLTQTSNRHSIRTLSISDEDSMLLTVAFDTSSKAVDPTFPPISSDRLQLLVNQSTGDILALVGTGPKDMIQFTTSRTMKISNLKFDK